MNLESLFTQFAVIYGEASVRTDERDLMAYQTGARYDSGRARAVLRPASTQEASQMVAASFRAGVHLIPQSGNTGLVSGSTPDHSGAQVVLSLDRLARTFTLDRDNRSVELDAGFHLSEVNKRLAQAGLFFPIDLGADPGIGGMIATNTGGTRFMRYGGVRANVLGLTVVLADAEGTILRLGGPVRKNNTGIDWKQMFIGTSGAFGVVTEAVLNVELLPLQTAAALLVPGSDKAVMPILRQVEQLVGSDLTAFEGMSRNAMVTAFDHIPSLRNPFAGGIVPDYAILLEISRAAAAHAEGASADDTLQSALSVIAEKEPELLAEALFGPADHLWALRHALSDGVKRAGRLIAFDLGFRRGDVMLFADRMKTELAETCPEVVVCDFGHIGDGGVHFNLVVPPASPLATDPDAERRLRDRVFEVAFKEFGGSFSAEHGIGRKNQGVYDHFTGEQEKRMARAFQKAIASRGFGSISFG